MISLALGTITYTSEVAEVFTLFPTAAGITADEELDPSNKAAILCPSRTNGSSGSKSTALRHITQQMKVPMET